MADNLDVIYRRWREGHDYVGGLDKVFLIGCPKSGTTWLARLLNAHPEVVIQGEGCFTWQLVPILAQAFRVFNEHQKHMEPIVHLRDIDLLLVARTIIDSQLNRYVTESGRDPASVRVVGDKTPQHTISIPLLDQLCPGAKFIHIIRDPRDVATSAWFHFGQHDRRPFEEYIKHFMTEVWPVNVGNARQHGPKLGPSRYVELRYEDLRQDEHGNARRLLEFLSVEADDGVVAACVEAASFKKLSGGRAPGQKDNKSFFRSGTSGDWRNHIPVELAERCCATIAPLMTACGYDPACPVGQAVGAEPQATISLMVT